MFSTHLCVTHANWEASAEKILLFVLRLAFHWSLSLYLTLSEWRVLIKRTIAEHFPPRVFLPLNPRITPLTRVSGSKTLPHKHTQNVTVPQSLANISSGFASRRLEGLAPKWWNWGFKTRERKAWRLTALDHSGFRVFHTAVRCLWWRIRHVRFDGRGGFSTT